MLLNLQFYMIFFTDFRFEYAASTVTKSSLGMFFSQALDICSFELLGVGLVVVYVVTRIQGSYLRRFRSGGTLDVHMPSERVILLVGFSYLILIFVLAHGGAEGFYRSVESLFQFRSNPFVELLDSSYSVYFEGSGSGFGRQLRYNGYDSSDYVFLSNIYPLVKASNHLACVHGLSGLDCSVDGDGDGFDRVVDCDDLNASIRPHVVEDSSTWVDENCDVSDNKKLNVVLVTMESARASKMGVYGGRGGVTPRIDALRDHSFIVDSFYSGSSFSCISMVSVLFSLHPYTGYRRITSNFRGVNLLGIQNVLGSEGYDTGLFLGSNRRTFEVCGEKRFMEDRGFDYWVVGEELEFLDGREWEGDLVLIEPLFEWVDEGGDTPFFAYVDTSIGHFPHRVPEEFNRFGYGSDEEGYLNTLYYTDNLVGEIYDGLVRRGIENETLIVLTGDHAQAFGEHGHYGHGVHVFEEYVRVPFILINPVFFHGEHDKSIMGRHVDIAPTILDVLNIDVVNPFQGESVFRGDPERSVFSVNAVGSSRSIREGDVKFIFDEIKDGMFLFNLSSDPSEKHDLSDEMQVVASDFRVYLRDFVIYQNTLIEEDRVWSRDFSMVSS